MFVEPCMTCDMSWHGGWYVTMQERLRCEQATDNLRQEVDRKRHQLTELRISVSDCPTVSRLAVRSPGNILGPSSSDGL